MIIVKSYMNIKMLAYFFYHCYFFTILELNKKDWFIVEDLKKTS